MLGQTTVFYLIVCLRGRLCTVITERWSQTPRRWSSNRPWRWMRWRWTWTWVWFLIDNNKIASNRSLKKQYFHIHIHTKIITKYQEMFSTLNVKRQTLNPFQSIMRRKVWFNITQEQENGKRKSRSKIKWSLPENGLSGQLSVILFWLKMFVIVYCWQFCWQLNS